MKASTKRAFSLLLSAALLIVALVVYAILIRPEYEIISQLRGQLLSESTLLDQQTTAMGQVQNLIAEYQGVAKLGDSLSLALPQEEAVSSIMNQLNAIAQASGLTIQSVGLNALSLKPSATSLSLSFARSVGTMRLDVKLIGSYGSIKKFLQSLETNIRLMDTKALKIEAAGKPDQDIFIVTATVDTYYQPK